MKDIQPLNYRRSMTALPSLLPWTVYVDGADLLVSNITATCFGGGHDKGDSGQTESGVMNDGRDTHLMGVALPIRSTEAATRNSPLAFKGPHIPWGTIVKVWRVADGEESAVECRLLDNGPNTLKFSTHALDVTVAVAMHFDPSANPETVANEWMCRGMSYRIVGGALFVS